jgi:hypothetical protein
MSQEFKIKLLDISWLEKTKEEEDQCAHGHVFLQIGGEIVSDQSKGNWTVSATALYLLRSIERDIEVGSFGSQLLPCCGHYLISELNKEVVILGCPNGIDWDIKHSNDEVIHTSENGSKATLPLSEYRRQVLAFVDEVKRFYEASKPKAEPGESEVALGFKDFWSEWGLLREKW